MALRKLKYALLILMLHVFANSCNNRVEIARLSHSTRSCFFGYKSDLTIYLHEGKVMAAYRIIGGPSQTSQLDQSQLEYFNSFAGELKKRNTGSLSTCLENYRLVMNSRTYYIEEGCSTWEGYSQLKQKLFDPSPGELIQP